jgi:hypothetical protein
MDTMSKQIVRRLCVPATPTELAAVLGKTPRLMCAMLYQLREQGRVQKLDRKVGRQTLWMANGTPDEIHELAILDCYHQWLEGEATWPELTALINRRSPQQVATMEAEKGLA